MTSAKENGGFDGVVRLTVGNSGDNTPKSEDKSIESIGSPPTPIPFDFDDRYTPPPGLSCLSTPDQWIEHSKQFKKKLIRKYYKEQGKLLKFYAHDREHLAMFAAKFGDRSPSRLEVDAAREAYSVSKNFNRVRKSDNVLAKVSIALNVCLVMAKLASAILSGSLVVIGSLLDSILDVTTGFVLWITNKAIKRSDFYHYPRGRSRLEPLAILIVSVIMGAVSMQMISKSIEMMAEHRIDLDIETPTIVIMGATVVMKFTAMIACYMFRSHQALVMALNHRNDCITNSIAIVCAYLADRYWEMLDPIAAILVGIFLMISWLRCGYRYIQLLSGKTAKPAFINRILKICIDHQPAIKQVDAVYAYYFGTKFLVEVIVIVDEDDERWPSAKKIYDVCDRLQKKLEFMDEVERAFVTVERLPLHLYQRRGF